MGPVIATRELAFETRNDLRAEVRAQVADLLDRRLAEVIDLSAQVKQAHWNVKGAQFSPLHLLFDAIHASTEEYVDLIAERVVQLGGVAHGTVRMAAERSDLKEYPLEAIDGMEHVAALSGALSQFGTRIRRSIEETSTNGDHDSADICTEVSRGIDKWLWMVEAHAQGRTVPSL
jgi:starvation-inducible DNA-binding protein